MSDNGTAVNSAIVNVIEKRWEMLVRRMRAEAERVLERRDRGAAVITVTIMVMKDGTPLLWVVPKGRLIEPTISVDSEEFHEILKMLGA